MTNFIRNLVARFSIDPSGVKSGTEEIKSKLTELNAAMDKTKREVKANNAVIKELEKQMKDTAKSTGTSSTAYTDLEKKLDQARLKAAQLTTTQQDLRVKIRSTTKELRDHSKGFDETAKSSEKASTSIFNVANAIKAVALGYTGRKLVDYLIGSNIEIERATASFETMLGSTEKANRLITNLQEMSSSTPFDLSELSGVSQMLLSYGENVDSLMGDLQMLGDISQGNAEKLSSLSLAFAQIQSTGRLTGQDLLQLINAGFNPLQVMAEKTGESVARLKEKMSEGAISFDMVRDAMKSATSEGGLFYQAMEKQSETMGGKLKALQSEIAAFGRNTGKEAFGELNDYLGELMEQLKQAKEDGTLSAIAEDVGNTIAGAVKSLVGFTRLVIEHKEAVSSLAVAYLSFKTAVTVGQAISTLVSAFKSLKTATNAATAAQLANNAAVKANPYVLLASTLLAVAGGLITYGVTSESASKKVKALEEATKQLEERLADKRAQSEAELSILERQAERYEELRNSVNLTSQEQSELNTIAKELQNVLGDGIPIIDEKTGKYKDLTKAVGDYIEKSRLEIDVEARKETAVEAQKQIIKAQEEIQAILDKENMGKSAIEGLAIELGVDFDIDWQSGEEIIKFYDDISRKIKDKWGAVWALTTDSYQQKRLLDDILGFAETIEKNQSKLNGYENAIKNLNGSTKELTDSTTDLNDEIQDNASALDGLNKSYNDVISSVTGLASAVDEQNKYGEISFSTYQKLISSGYGLATSQDSQTGAIKLNINALKDLALAQISAIKNQMELDTVLLRSQANFANNIHKGYSYALKEMERARETERAIAEKKKSWQLQIQSLERLANSIKQGDYSGNYGKSYSGSTSSSTATSATKTKTKTAAEIAKENYEKELSYQKWRLDMGQISEKIYLSKISELRKKYSKMDIDTYRKSQLEEKQLKDKLIADKANKAKQAYQELNQIKKDGYQADLDNAKKVRDARIKAIDDEIEARKRLREDDDIQKKIDSVTARLEYEQMDDLSRRELEKSLKNLEKERSDMLWDRNAQDRKASINADYERAEIRIGSAIKSLEDSMKTAEKAFELLAQGQKVTNSVINQNTSNNNFKIVNPYLSSQQIAKDVLRELKKGM